MSITELRANFDSAEAGRQCKAWIEAWYPWNRSITGDGLRAQLRALQAFTPLDIHEVPTGTPVFDWTVPMEWNIRDAFVKDADGNRVIDFQQHNLHVMGYSTPVHAWLSREDLVKRCHTLPDQPDRIPYRTSYYREDWAFCAAQEVIEALPEGTYEVYIDASLRHGALSYGEVLLPGDTDEEVLISAHICHPSLANDNLSAVAVALWLARALQGVSHRYTYRFVFAPGTIGAITWLAQHEDIVPRLRHGLVLACLGDKGMINYKRSRQENAAIDRTVEAVLTRSEAPHAVHPFTPYGYDERQYNSPGFNLPVGCLMRSRPGTFPEYHSSGDNLALISEEALADSLATLLAILETLEGDETYLNLNPCGEPQLGKRGLYSHLGGRTDTKAFEMALLWVLNYSDGEHSLLDIAGRSELDFAVIRQAANALIDAGLLAPVESVDSEFDEELSDDYDQESDAPNTEASASSEADAADFWDDFLEDDDLDLSNESLADFFKDQQDTP